MNSQPFVLYVNHPPSELDVAAMSALTEPPAVPADVLSRYIEISPVTPSVRTTVPQAVLRDGGMPTLLDRAAEKLSPPGAATIETVRHVVAAIRQQTQTQTQTQPQTQPPSYSPYASPQTSQPSYAPQPQPQPQPQPLPPPQQRSMFTGQGLVQRFSGCMGTPGSCALPFTQPGYSIGSSFDDAFGSVLGTGGAGATTVSDRVVKAPVLPGRPPLRYGAGAGAGAGADVAQYQPSHAGGAGFGGGGFGVGAGAAAGAGGIGFGSATSAWSR
jgi:hypothetical protein